MLAIGKEKSAVQYTKKRSVLSKIKRERYETATLSQGNNLKGASINSIKLVFVFHIK